MPGPPAQPVPRATRVIPERPEPRVIPGQPALRGLKVSRVMPGPPARPEPRVPKVIPGQPARPEPRVIRGPKAIRDPPGPKLPLLAQIVHGRVTSTPLMEL